MKEHHTKILTESGIKFSGRMTSLSTHELKNALAIINENAGLLEDLSSLPQQSLSKLTDRINRMSRHLVRQVKRSDTIVKNLNRFSHTMDQPESLEELDKVLDFILELASRFIDMQQVDIKIAPPSKPVCVLTNLFWLNNILWRAVESVCLAAKSSKKVFISFDHLPEPSIWFTTGLADELVPENILDGDEDDSLSAYLDIKIDRVTRPNSFGLLWPKKV